MNLGVSRSRLVVANAKMNLTPAEAERWASSLLAAQDRFRGVTVGLAPAFPALERVARVLTGSPFLLVAQDVFQNAAGAYTGEVCATMLRDLGVSLVIVGHSERRSIRKETEADFSNKMARLAESGLSPLYCVGETLEEREGGRAEKVLERQMAALDPFPSVPPGLALAYEPVWAIGSGRPATAEMASEVHAGLRRMLASRYGGGAAAGTAILYGGSVTPENAPDLFGRDGIDGALVGGASLDPKRFAAILEAAARA
jgi:triosephosphate isomerase